MRFYQIKNLMEGSGLRAGTPGEIYTDENSTNKDEYTFIEWDYNYPEDRDMFANMEELDAGLKAIQQANPDVTFKLVKQMTPRMKSFAFAKFARMDDKGNKIPKSDLWLTSFYSRKSPGNTILDKEARLVGLSAGSVSSTSSVKGKMNSKLQPGDLGLGDNKARSVGQVIAEVGKDPNNGPMLAKGATEASSNEAIVFDKGKPIIGALQDDFMEVVAPIAIINKHQAVKGPINVAIDDIWSPGFQLDNATIMFPEGQNNPLVDCYISKDGIQMGVSHKGKTGANASISNIWKAKESAKKTQTGQTYIKQYAEAVHILDICANESAAKQPLTLAIRYGIITKEEAADLYAIVEKKANRYTEDQKLTGDRNTDRQKGPASLLPMFDKIAYKPGSYFGLVVLSSIAKDVAKYINDPNATHAGQLIDFGEAIRKFLNSSAMIQATSILGAQGEDAAVRSIGVVYPPNFKEKATIENSPYYGTDIKSRFAFKLPKT
jgi:hypothetical protein